MIFYVKTKGAESIATHGALAPIRCNGRDVFCGSTLLASLRTKEAAAAFVQRIFDLIRCQTRWVEVEDDALRAPGETLPPASSQLSLASRLVQVGVRTEDGRRLAWVSTPSSESTTSLSQLGRRESR